MQSRPQPSAQGASYFPKKWEWIYEEWTGSDAPFLLVEQRIAGEKKRASSLEARIKLVARYEREAKRQPKNALKQYAWVYAAILSDEAGKRVNKPPYQEASAALEKASSPHTYRYARARYVVLMTWGIWPRLKQLGERLLERNLDDYDVKYRYVLILAAAYPSEHKKALAYGLQLVRDEPERVSAHAALGAVYRNMFAQDHNPETGRKAIASYQKALDLKPSKQKASRLKMAIDLVRDQLPQ